MEHITSRANPLIARVRKLANDAAYRRESAAFVCDGIKLLNEALLPCAAGGDNTVETVLFSDTAYPGGAGLPPMSSAVRLVEVPDGVLSVCSPSKTPQGVLCVCAIPPQVLPDTLDGRRYLALDGVQDPGNVGTILRTADAFGADGLFLLPGCADLYHPRTVRASMGAVFRLPAWTCQLGELADLLDRSRLSLYGAALRADAKDPRETDLFRCALAIGSEGRGLSAEVLDLCAGVLRIPMRARCESLNAAAAAAVLLWEAARHDDDFA
ncbi:MAG: RNA methyltransferase [Oscillibacter sp.]|nr:RNA methyltransferase [Oscillibacter sp.]